MFLDEAIQHCEEKGLPRIRGGVSLLQGIEFSLSESSPHTRGCFRQLPPALEGLRVFPAYAGVFPMMQEFSTDDLSLPRIRGGVSS